MHDVWVFTEHVEFEHFSIILQELLLIFDSASSQLALHVVFHVIISHRDELDIGLLIEVVLRSFSTLTTRSSDIRVELFGVIITISDHDVFAIDFS